jgi:hypothetical protein
VWVIPPRPGPCGKRDEPTPAADLAARANLWLRAAETGQFQQIGHGDVTTAHPRGDSSQDDRAAGRRRRGRLRGVWHRIRLTVQEMNYSARRVIELQAPWIVDEKRRSR